MMEDEWMVSTIAGNGKQGFHDGNALEAMFNKSNGICVSHDDKLYVTDTNNARIRMINKAQVITIAGNGYNGFQDGNSLSAMFHYPFGICISRGGKIYVADRNNHRIRMIYNGQVTTIAGNGTYGFQDGKSTHATFDHPEGICISGDGKLYISDSYNNKIRMIYNGQVTTLAGNGKHGFQDGDSKDAMFDNPLGICISLHNEIYVADRYNSSIRKIYRDEVTTIACNGYDDFPSANVLNIMFLHPVGICISGDNKLYIVNQNNNKISMIDNNQVITIVGNAKKHSHGRESLNTMFPSSNAICVSQSGKIYVNDDRNHQVRMICKQKDTVIAIHSMSFDFSCPVTMASWNYDTTPDFVILISNDDKPYHVHKSVLSSRWRYFAIMIQAGLQEAKENKMVLSDDWTASRLNKFLHYIYLDQIYFDDMDDAKWLLEHAALYMITENKPRAIIQRHQEQQCDEAETQQDNAKTHQDNAETHQDNAETQQDKLFDTQARVGFESLYDHCLFHGG